MIIKIIKSLFQSPKQTCINLYNEAKKKKPGKEEIEYLKVILLTKPPFDYQLDEVIDTMVTKFESIEELSDFVIKVPKDDYFWESRTRNLKINKKQLEERNRLFFQKFWS